MLHCITFVIYEYIFKLILINIMLNSIIFQIVIQELKQIIRTPPLHES